MSIGRIDPYAYAESKKIAALDYSFYGLLIALMRQADSNNAQKLKALFPDTWEYASHCYNCAGCAECGRDKTNR